MTDSDRAVVEAALTRIRGWTDGNEARKRASQLHASDDSRSGYFFLIQGLRTDVAAPSEEEGRGSLRATFADLQDASRIDFGFSQIHNYPSTSDLAVALQPNSQHLYATLASLKNGSLQEMFISSELAANPQVALNMAHRVLYLLRARTHAVFAVPAWASISWNQVSGLSEVVEAGLVGNEWNQTPLVTGEAVTSGDVVWAIEQTPNAFALYELPAFRIAFDAVGGAPFGADARAAIALVWSGIEAIFGVQQELSYRLALYAATLLTEDPEERLERFVGIKRLYGSRSKAVHGSHLKQSDVSTCLVESWRLLGDLLCILAERGTLPTPAQFDAALLGADLWP